jgi:hypothetical protein
MAGQVWWYGCIHDDPYEGIGRGENRRLKKMYAESKMDVEILQEAVAIKS